MGLVRATPLLTTIGEVVDLTSHQDLGELEVDGEFSVADSLAKAHEWVYDRLKRRWKADVLTALTNETELKRAVAFRLLQHLAALSLIGPNPEGLRDYYGDLLAEELHPERGFQPDYESNAPVRAGRPVPSVTNTTTKKLFKTSLG